MKEQVKGTDWISSWMFRTECSLFCVLKSTKRYVLPNVDKLKLQQKDNIQKDACLNISVKN